MKNSNKSHPSIQVNSYAAESVLEVSSIDLQSEVRLVILIAVSVFICEAFVMFVISRLPAFSTWIRALLDAGLLVILLAPVLYFGLFRRLVQHVAERQRADVALKKHRANLEIVINERTAELTKANEQLNLEIKERKQTEAELKKRTYDLDERVKELNCLYGISALRENRGLNLSEILEGIVNLLPLSWQYPQIACARIIAKGDEFATANYNQSQWRQVGEIRPHGRPLGTVEVCYLEPKPDSYEGPFLKEERFLINAVAERVGHIIERIEVEEKLEHGMRLNKSLSKLYKPLITPTSSVEEIASTVLKTARRLTGSSHGFVSTIDPETGDNVSHTLTAMLKGECKVGPERKIAFPRNEDGTYHGLWGYSLNSLKPFFTNSPQTHQARVGVPEGHIPIHRFLSVPVMLGKELVGQIALSNKDEDYDDQDLEAVGRIAEFYALAIQRNRGEEELQKTKAELEKRVEERTIKLEDRTIKLVQANEKLMAEINERIRFQAQLEQSKSIFQAVVDGISDPLVLLNPNMKVKMLNKSAAEYYGLSEYRQLIDSTCHQMLRDSVAPCEGCEVPAAIYRGKSIMFERKGFMDPDRLEHVYIYPAKKKDGNHSDVLMRISDVTEQRLFEKQLIHSEKMASLGVLVSSVAHEINNPVNFISFNIPILRDYCDEMMPFVDAHAADHPDMEICHMTYNEFRQDLSDLIDNIEHGSERISTFVSNLKEFSQVKDQIKEEHIQLNVLLENVLSICRVQLQKSAKSIVTNIPDNPATIWSDPYALEQILINLLVNAAQASKKQASRIELNVEIRPTWLDHTIFEVKDNGEGMDGKTLDKIFDPFFTTKARSGGTGLGLYVCHNLVESLRGRIEVESAPGMGSSFRVILPDKERRAKKRI